MPSHAALPKNVRLLGQRTSERVLVHLLAGASRVVMLSLDEGVMRRPGVITYVTAMRLGKCVVVNGPPRRTGVTSPDGKTGTGRAGPATRWRLGTRFAAYWKTVDCGRRLGANARAFAAAEFSAGRYAADLTAAFTPAERLAG